MVLPIAQATPAGLTRGALCIVQGGKTFNYDWNQQFSSELWKHPVLKQYKVNNLLESTFLSELSHSILFMANIEKIFEITLFRGLIELCILLWSGKLLQYEEQTFWKSKGEKAHRYLKILLLIAVK